MFHVGKTGTKAIFWICVVASMLLVVLVLTVKYVVMPNIERYQGDIVSRAASATGMDVSASAIRGGWAGFRPYVELENVVLREPANATKREAGSEALRLPRVQAALSWWSLFVGQIRFADVALTGPELALSRGKDGLIYFAGRALNQPQDVEDDGRLLEALLEQPGVSIHNATLTWTDELTPGQPVKFTDVGLLLEKRTGGHAFGVVAIPPAGQARNVEMRGTVNIGRESGRWKVAGSLYTVLNEANLAEIRQHITLPDALQSGFGNVRAWIDIDSTAAPLSSVPVATVAADTTDGKAVAAFNPIRGITADVNLVNARAQLANDLAPLQIAKLAGRIEYVALDGGFTVRSKALEFRTREGVTSPAADFSVTLQHQSEVARATGEITANGIDLKVMTALLEYFPIGKEMRAGFARFSPRGVVQQSVFSWTGAPDNPITYKVKGKLTEFGSLTADSVPGVSGFSGTMDGNEQGGRFAVTSKDLRLDAPLVFRVPLTFSSLETEGEWKVTPELVELTLSGVKFANDDLAGEFSGRYWRYRADGPRAAEEKGPGSLDLKGKFERIKAIRVPDYLPNGIADTRAYIESATRDGDVTSVDFILKGALYDFPYQHGKGGQFRIDAKVKDIDFRYLEGWPDANDINGTLTFENTRFEAKVDTAKIFNAPLRQTTVAIDDFSGSPPVLTIQGTADARAEDMTRYLKESPLIENIGAFTRHVALEGPGKLELGLMFFLGSKQQARVNGKYAVTRGRAKVLALGERGVDITGLNGSVAFTESSVKSMGLAGVAFENPLTVSIAGAGETPVTVDFNARADVTQLGDILPFRLPQQVAGTTDFTGRVLPKGADNVEVVIESTMAGIASTLPAPLAKRQDETRKLRVVFSNTGHASEKIRVTMAGNAPAATPAADNSDTRIDARFQRRFDARGMAKGGLFGGIASVGDPVGDSALPEGMWLAGTMAYFDFDGWRAAFDTFSQAPITGVSPKVDSAGARNESPIAGFDFKLGGLLAYGRPFKAMTLKGRHGSSGWHMNVDSVEASGDFTWRPAAFSDRGLVRARLQRFTLTDETPALAATSASPAVPPPAPIEPGKEPDFPALDIVAEKFTFKDHELGKLELRATPQGVNWKIDQLNITNGHAKLEMQGLWQRYGDPQGGSGRSQTSMNLKMETSNLNALFNQFGYGDYLKGGDARLEGQLSWPGHVNQFQTGILSGNFKISASDGRFAKMDPGAGKLLGLMSLQSLPRRITLDFRDIFSEGLAFNKIEGDVKIANGIMSTDNFEIKGPAAYIKTSGEVSLPTELVNLKTKVSPLVGEGAALGAAVFLTPVVGAGVYAVSKLLEGVLSYELSITGPWDNPQSEPIKKNAPVTPVTPSADTARKTP